MLRQARLSRHRKRKVDRDQTKREEQDEVAQLRTKVARLENALAQAIASSDAVLDLRSYEEDLDVLAAQPVTGFAAAWSSSSNDTQDQIGETFFASSQIDQRARSWLLATK